jgi:serine phosphatase RsbU (regulator of sigma subunit)
MLELKDFFLLPQVDALIEQLVADKPGLVIVAGLDPRLTAAAQPASGGFLPSGRATVFGILARQILAAHPMAQAIVVAETKDAVRLPNSLRRQVKLALVKPPLTYADQLAAAIRQRPAVMVIDQLNAETAPAALQAGQAGIHVLSQLDCVFSGAGVARHLLDLGVAEELLDGLTWVVTVQRLSTLCADCRQPARLDPGKRVELHHRYPDLPLDGAFFRAAGCATCHDTGKAGDVAAFDFFRPTAPPPDLFEQPSLLAMEEYVLHLAIRGHVSLDDLVRFGADQLHRTYLLLTASERALKTANAELRQRLAELETANRVLQQRTGSLISLQETAQTLITSMELEDLASRISRHVRDLCGADRSILYVLRPDVTAEVVSVSGWDPDLVHLRLEAMQVFGSASATADYIGNGPEPFDRWPPGIPPRHPDVEGAALRAGLRVPLIAQNEVVGLMIVHSTRKSQFAAGEVALLQAFANQAAMAIQRTGLVEALREKITQLETAQAELIQKERLERELELARQVQQSLLPRVFPRLPGYEFAARNEAARRVGGDFYDVFALDDERFGVVIADVSDKGMPAALFMALTRSLLLAEARRELSPRSVLESVHRLLLELGEPEMFVTIFYGVVDMAGQTLTYTRAGHEKPLLLRDGTVLSLGGQGIFLGFLDADKLVLSEEQVQLKPGDRLVLYTDGLVDALSPDEQPFGLDRLQGFLGAHAGLSPTELCAATFAELAAYQGSNEQFDDMAMLVVEVNGEA